MQCLTLSGTDVTRAKRGGGGGHGAAGSGGNVKTAAMRAGVTGWEASFACDAATLVNPSSVKHAVSPPFVPGGQCGQCSLPWSAGAGTLS